MNFTTLLIIKKGKQRMANKNLTLAPFPTQKGVLKDAQKNTNYYKNNGDGIRADIRIKNAIAKASDDGRCWWIAQYLRQVL